MLHQGNQHLLTHAQSPSPIQKVRFLLDTLYPESDASQDQEIRQFRDTVLRQLNALEGHTLTEPDESELQRFIRELKAILANQSQIVSANPGQPLNIASNNYLGPGASQYTEILGSINIVQIANALEQSIVEHLNINIRIFHEKKWIKESIPRAALYINISKNEKEELAKQLAIQMKKNRELMVIISKNSSQSTVHYGYLLDIHYYRLTVSFNLNQGLHLHQKMQYSRALEHLDTALDQVIKYTELLCQEEIGQEDKATLLNLVSAILNAKGIVHRTNENFVESFRYYHLAILINTNDAFAYSNQGFLLALEMKLNERAVVYHFSADCLNKNNTAILNGLGDVVCEVAEDVEMKRFEKSKLEDYLKTSEIVGARANVFLTNITWDHKDALLGYAKDLYTKALGVSSGYHDNCDPIIFENRALLFVEMRAVDSALDDFDSAIKQRGNYGRANYYRGYLKAIKEDYDGAVQDFKKAREIQSDNPSEYNLINAAIQICELKKEGKKKSELFVFSLEQTVADYHDLNQSDFVEYIQKALKLLMTDKDDECNLVITFPFFIEATHIRKPDERICCQCFEFIFAWISENQSKNKFKQIKKINCSIEKAEELLKSENIDTEARCTWLANVYSIMLKESKVLFVQYQEYYRKSVKEIYDAWVKCVLTSPFPTPDGNEMRLHNKLFALMQQGETRKTPTQIQSTMRINDSNLTFYTSKSPGSQSDKEEYSLNAEGVKKAHLGLYSKGLEYFECALLLNNQNKEVLKNKAWMLNSLGLYTEAIKCCERVLDLDETFIEAWLDKGVALIYLDRHDEALCCLDKAITLDDEEEWIYLYYSLVSAEKKDWKQTAKHVNKALQLNKEWPRALCMRSILDGYSNNHQMPTFEQIMDMVEGFFVESKFFEDRHERIMTYYFAGRLFCALNHVEVAKDCFKKCTQFSPEFKPACDAILKIDKMKTATALQYKNQQAQANMSESKLSKPLIISSFAKASDIRLSLLQTLVSVIVIFREKASAEQFSQELWQAGYTNADGSAFEVEGAGSEYNVNIPAELYNQLKADDKAYEKLITSSEVAFFV